jgi:sirohydrochlorin cobaltochelatase
MADFSIDPFSKRALITSLLTQGEWTLGELLVRADFSIRHHADQSLLEQELKLYDTPEAAREISRYNAQGIFRSLKMAPSLRRGWLLQLENVEQVMLALDFFYPAALDLYGSFLQKKLSITSLRETLDRQTGMYRITQLLTDEQAQELIGKTCSSDHGCLRKVLWSISSDQEITTLPKEKKNATASPQEIPLLCREACNLLVAAARPLAKKNLPS